MLASSAGVLPAGLGRRGSLDVAGALLVTAALSLAVFGIVRAPEIGWAATVTLVTLGAAAVLLALFVGVQAMRHDPLMPLSIWRAPNLAAANVAMAFLGAAWIPMWFFLNLYLQQVLGFGAFAGGLALLPMTLTIMVLMVGVTARVVGRFGFKAPIVVGLLVLAAGIGWLSRVPAGGGYLTDVLLATIVAATGMSLAYIPALLAALSGAKPEESGLASGIVNTTYQVGSALGLAVLTAVATMYGAGQLGNLPALVAGFQAAFIGAALVATVGAVLALTTLRPPAAIAAATSVDLPAGVTDHDRQVAA